MAEAHVLSLKHILQKNESITLNLGTSSGFSVREVLNTSRAVTERSIPSEDMPRREGDPAILIADASAAQKALNWSPQLSSLEKIIETAWKWQQKKNKLGKKEALSFKLNDHKTSR